MLTKMDGKEVKGSPKDRTEIRHQRITCRRTEIQLAQERTELVENLVENLAQRVERDKESRGIKRFPR